MGKYMKGAITILVLSIPNFIWGQAVVAAPIEVEKSEIAPMEFSWNYDCVSDMTWQDMDRGEPQLGEVMKKTRACTTYLVYVPAQSEQLHQLNRYNNGMPATAMLSSEIYFREY